MLRTVAGRVGISDLASVAHGPVPFLARELVPLPPSRHAAFVAHLDAVIEQAFEAPDPELEAEPGTDPVAEEKRFARRLQGVPDDPPALAATCMACRGFCCLNGARTHAFLTPESLAFFRHLNPGTTGEETRAAYIAHLPDHHIEGSCVYHGERGCILPRTQRAGICNHWQCSDRIDLEAQLRAGGSQASLIVALPDAGSQKAPRSVAVLPSGRIVFGEEVGSDPEVDLAIQ
ncbi:hypothetical protein BH23GEM11_BH23GEM11_15970 [soil metagenome]